MSNSLTDRLEHRVDAMDRQRMNARPSDSHKLDKFLFITQHDFRTDRKTNIHFVSEEMTRHGEVRVFSLGFSLLSLIRNDPRLSLYGKANKVELYKGVYCYLWRSLLHPIDLKMRSLDPIANMSFALFRSLAPNPLKEWILTSTHIFVESGLPVIFFDLIKRINSKAKIVYLCSDDLETIGCAKFLLDDLERTLPHYTSIIVPSRKLAAKLPAGARQYFIPHALDSKVRDVTPISPFEGGVNAVSVGSMLFDAAFFSIAAAAFPNIEFHVIGGGPKAKRLRARNIRIYGEMPFSETIAFLKHADFGIAPYQGAKVSDYLADTSMKLMQYGLFGLPAVCPTATVGTHVGRFGYEPDKAETIIAAIKGAMALGRFSGPSALNWAQVTERMIDPSAFDDTRI